jgi:hypothetical protein
MKEKQKEQNKALSLIPSICTHIYIHIHIHIHTGQLMVLAGILLKLDSPSVALSLDSTAIVSLLRVDEKLEAGREE